MGEFNAQDLANASWTFAMMGQSDAAPVASLVREAQQRVGSSKVQGLANIAWAFATVGQVQCLG